MQKYAHYDLKGKSYHEIEIQNERDRERSFPGLIATSFVQLAGFLVAIFYLVLSLYPLAIGQWEYSLYSAQIAAWALAAAFAIPVIRGLFFDIHDRLTFIPTRVADQFEAFFDDHIKVYSTGAPGVWMVEYPAHPETVISTLSAREVKTFLSNSRHDNLPIAEFHPRKSFLRIMSTTAAPKEIKVKTADAGTVTLVAKEDNGKISLARKP